MIVVYYKIFRAARRIVLEERRAQTHLETHSYVQAASMGTPAPTTPTRTPVPSTPTAATPATNNGCMANKRNSLSSHSLLVEGDASGPGGCAASAGGEGRDAAYPTRHTTGVSTAQNKTITTFAA